MTEYTFLWLKEKLKYTVKLKWFIYICQAKLKEFYIFLVRLTRFHSLTRNPFKIKNSLFAKKKRKLTAMLVWYVLRVMFSTSENTIIKNFIDFSSKETFNHIAFVYVFGRTTTAQLKSRLKTRSTAFEMKLFKHMALWTAALIGAVKWQISFAFSLVSLLNKKLQLSNTANQVKKHTGSGCSCNC